MNQPPIVVNLFAAPSSGKSTMAAGLFYHLKTMGVECELVSEFAKDLVWANRHDDLKNQLYIHAKQSYRIDRVADKCDVVITDSPVLMGLAYATDDYPQCFRDTVAWSFNRYTNINILIERTAPYNPIGRVQTETQASEKQRMILDLLHEYDVNYQTVTGDDSGLEFAKRIVVNGLNRYGLDTVTG